MRISTYGVGLRSGRRIYKIMSPFIIGIGGAHSGSGKTTVACRLFKEFAGLGAIKCTPSPLYSCVTDDPEVLGREDKDTGRYLEAGAERAVWVRATDEDLQETLSMAVSRLSDLGVLIVEGNSAIEVLKPNIVIFITGEPGRFKESARRVLDMADIVLYDRTPPHKRRGSAGCYELNEGWGEVIARVSRAIDGRGRDKERAH